MAAGNLQKLINTVGSGDVESVRSFLTNHRMNLNQAKPGGVSPLMVAAKSGYLEIVQLLLRKGADVNFESGGWTALMKAVEGEQVEVVKLLMKKDAIQNGDHTLTIAFKQGNIEIVKALLPTGAQGMKEEEKVTFQTKMVHFDRWYFHYAVSLVNQAVENGHTELVTWFLGEAKMKVPFGALFLAISRVHGNLALVEVLLKHGADANLKGDCGRSALMMASYYGHATIVQALLNNGANVDYQGGEKKLSALIISAMLRKPDVVEVLLENGAQLNLKNADGMSALMLAVATHSRKEPQEKVIKLLLDKGADVNIDSHHGHTALILAAKCQDPHIVTLLLEKGALVNQISDGQYALRVAAQDAEDAPFQAETMKLLLEAGAETDIRHWTGSTILMNTFKLQTVKLLLDSGASINLQDNYGNYALLVALQRRCYDVVGLLLEYGANPHLVPESGNTALKVIEEQVEHIVVGLVARLNSTELRMISFQA
jgi:serine/threonine-protein phosphatase 6 regulatory ankyrin repeat subunit B